MSIVSLQTDYKPASKGSTYRADALIIHRRSTTACLVDFKRQVSTIETTKLNRIADNLTVARAQVGDFLYQYINVCALMRMQSLGLLWIVTISKTYLPALRIQVFFGLESLDMICGVRNICSAYRLAQKYMTEEFTRGEAELMAEQQMFIPSQNVEDMIKQAVEEAKLSFDDNSILRAKKETNFEAINSKVSQMEHHKGYQEMNDHLVFKNDPASLRRTGMFGT